LCVPGIVASILPAARSPRSRHTLFLWDVGGADGSQWGCDPALIELDVHSVFDRDLIRFHAKVTAIYQNERGVTVHCATGADHRALLPSTRVRPSWLRIHNGMVRTHQSACARSMPFHTMAATKNWAALGTTGE
jgi:hypothetical protein